jgi:hypothetical protein
VAMPSDYLPAPGRDPHTGEEREFFVSRSELEKLEEFGPKQKFLDARLIEETLRDPDVIFQGLKRPGYNDGYCYAKVPSCWWFEADSGPIEAPPPPDMVFLVFVRPIWGLVVFDWEWRPEDSSDPYHPEQWKAYFEKKLWESH